MILILPIFVRVKKALAIFFCLQILSGNTFAMEMMKLPQLVMHYFDHEKEEHPGLSFGSFLWEHYVDGEQKDESKGHCDEDLPFKHCNDCCTHSVATIVCLVPNTSIDIHYPVVGNEINFTGNDHFRSFYQCCIWQPPKIG